MNRRHIPTAWTGEQAWAVAQFLQELLDDIWDVHGFEMAELRRAQIPCPNQLWLDFPDSDLPF